MSHPTPMSTKPLTATARTPRHPQDTKADKMHRKKLSTSRTSSKTTSRNLQAHYQRNKQVISQSSTIAPHSKQQPPLPTRPLPPAPPPLQEPTKPNSNTPNAPPLPLIPAIELSLYPHVVSSTLLPLTSRSMEIDWAATGYFLGIALAIIAFFVLVAYIAAKLINILDERKERKKRAGGNWVLRDLEMEEFQGARRDSSGSY